MRNDLLVLLAARLINSTATVVYFTFGWKVGKWPSGINLSDSLLFHSFKQIQQIFDSIDKMQLKGFACEIRWNWTILICFLFYLQLWWVKYRITWHLEGPPSSGSHPSGRPAHGPFQPSALPTPTRRVDHRIQHIWLYFQCKFHSFETIPWILTKFRSCDSWVNLANSFRCKSMNIWICYWRVELRRMWMDKFQTQKWESSCSQEPRACNSVGTQLISRSNRWPH